MIDRAATVRSIVGTPNPDEPVFQPHENCGPAFAGMYPGGFAPISSVKAGSVLEYCAEHVVLVGEGLSDDEFVALCEAIREWQWMSLANFRFGLSGDVTVRAFIADDPDSATILAAAATRLGMDLGRFLGLHD